MTPQAEALAALHEVVARLHQGPITVASVVIEGLVVYAMTQVEAIQTLKRPRRARLKDGE